MNHRPSSRLRCPALIERECLLVSSAKYAIDSVRSAPQRLRANLALDLSSPIFPRMESPVSSDTIGPNCLLGFRRPPFVKLFYRLSGHDAWSLLIKRILSKCIKSRLNPRDAHAVLLAMWT